MFQYDDYTWPLPLVHDVHELPIGLITGFALLACRLFHQRHERLDVL